MMKIIDISVPISRTTPLWPKTPKPRFSFISSLKEGDAASDTKMETSLHTGTHIDAPSHFLRTGKSIDTLPLETFIGSAYVVSLQKVQEITAAVLTKLSLPKRTKRLLFKTTNSLYWHKDVSQFQKKYVGLTPDAALWLAKQKIKLVGIDYLSIAKFTETTPVHHILLRKNIAILEGLNLSNVKQGMYQLIAAPLMIPGAEAAPARAVLIKL